MISIIGTKRLVIIGAMIAVNAALAGAFYLFLTPQNQKLERDLRSTRSQIAEKRSEADRLRTEFDAIQSEKARFEDLGNAGFFSLQDRLDARKRIEAIQGYSKVLTAKYNISPGVPEKIDTAVPADQLLLKSPMMIELNALDDNDVYHFIYLMENAFAGHVSVRNIELQRVQDLTEVTLRQIGSGIPATLVTGKVEFAWRTMLPQEQIAPAGPDEGMGP